MDEHTSRQGQDRDSNPATGPKRTVSKGYTSKAQSAGKAVGTDKSAVNDGTHPAAKNLESGSPLREIKPIEPRLAESAGGAGAGSGAAEGAVGGAVNSTDHKSPELKPPRPASRGSDPYHGDRRPMDPIIPIPGGPSLKGTEGAVKWFDPRKGFGFIVGPEGQDIFVHYTIIEGDGFRVLKDGSAVVYDAVKTEKGWKATRVMRVEGAEPGEITTAPRRGYTRTPRR